MGIFDKFKKKRTTADISFASIPPTDTVKLEWSRDFLEDPSAYDLETHVRKMFEDASEFVTLTPRSAIEGIRYIQACLTDDGISVQLGLEDGKGIRLVEKTADEEEALSLFMDFYHGKADIDTGKYRPVRLYQ